MWYIARTRKVEDGDLYPDLVYRVVRTEEIEDRMWHLLIVYDGDVGTEPYRQRLSRVKTELSMKYDVVSRIKTKRITTSSLKLLIPNRATESSKP